MFAGELPEVSHLRLRIVEPELLDSLPPDDPAAMRSRADLRRVNWWMRNEVYVANAILGLPHSASIIMEVGAGDGTFMLGVARRLAAVGKRPVRVYLLDVEPVVTSETIAAFSRLEWEAIVIRQSLEGWLATAENVDLIAANLFLHHFSDEQLKEFFFRFSSVAKAVMSCEPRRWTPALISCRLLGLIGCNYVTRHDAQISVRAGFRDRELSKLWPSNSPFEISEQEAGLASHLFQAVRREC